VRVNINLKIIYGLIEPRTMREDRRVRTKYAMLGVAAIAAFSTAAYSMRFSTGSASTGNRVGRISFALMEHTPT